MGCGCRKKKSANAPTVELTPEQQKAIRDASIQRANRALAQSKAAAAAKQAQLKQAQKQAQLQQSIILVNSRKAICDSCSLCVFNDEKSDNKFKICSKCNRPIYNICSDPTFDCPIGKF